MRDMWNCRKSFIIYEKRGRNGFASIVLQPNFGVCRSIYMFVKRSMIMPCCVIAICLGESLFFAFIFTGDTFYLFLTHTHTHTLFFLSPLILAFFVSRSGLSVKVISFALFYHTHTRSSLFFLLIHSIKKNQLNYKFDGCVPLIYSWFVFFLSALYANVCSCVFVIRWCLLYTVKITRILARYSDQW